MLKADTRPWMQTLGLLAGIGLVLGLGDWMFKGAPLWLVPIGSAAFCLILWVPGGRHQWKELRRTEQRRQSAITAPSGFRWPGTSQPLTRQRFRCLS